VVVDKADRGRALTDSRGDALQRPVPDVADREDPGQGFRPPTAGAARMKVWRY
jgi:hypothetical protein